ncbi:hypothetical protein PFISCL1PPCAC_20532, partial [Pristionchus fissidentatus]
LLFSSLLFSSLFQSLKMTSRIIKLTSNDDQTFEVERDAIKLSVTVNTLITDLNLDDEDVPAESQMAIPLPNVNAATLKKVIEWCNYHKGDPAPKEEDEMRERRTDDIPQWDQEFLKVEQATLFEIILAANYMDIKGLLDNCCKTVANMIKGKTVEQIRTTFNIKNDFTPEEEEQIRKENAWCED